VLGSNSNEFISSTYIEAERKKYPEGNFNLGLSHGITGPLAFLSLSCLHGMTNETMVGDIMRLSAWIYRWQVNNSFGIYWPGRVSYEEFIQNEMKRDSIENIRDSWCYGTLGIARSLWLAGHAVNNKEWKETGLQAYVDIEKRIKTFGGITSSTICHGVGGLLHLIQRMYSDTGHETLGALRDKLVVTVLERYAPHSMFGYYDEQTINGASITKDNAGFLTGTSGVALVLASLLSKESPDWDLILLIR
ncbi:lanthionine synthetase C family protein, partial [Paenibacillus tianmuensis]|uniref:lanthionine synthetase C family protein n=1 Tax=Paenibacillus tianmuensis TaxID=624147 RepID=UPI00143022D2